MPTLRSREKDKIFRALGIGDSGTGKTGSLVPVINNMEELGLKRVIIADFDNGLDVLASFVKPEVSDKVFFETFRDELRTDMDLGAVMKTEAALEACWSKLVRYMSNWPEVGSINALGADTLFVADSLTGLGDIDINYVRAFGEKGKRDSWTSIGAAMALQDKFVQLCIALNCHFILFSHIRYMGGGGKKIVEDKHGSKYQTQVDSADDGNAYPSALGRILPTTIGRHFNTMIGYRMLGSRRVIRTKAEDRFGFKVPFDVPSELPQETGLYILMKGFLGK